MAMKQQCYVWNIWLTWLALPAMATIIGILQSWMAAGFVLVVGVLAQILYVVFFPRLSRLLGYGSVKDVKAESISPVIPLGLHVTLYTANVCPFCPIVKGRLHQLQTELNFVLEEVDITFRPQVVRAKGFRSVPVIESDDRYLMGNATTAELSAFLTESRVAGKVESV